MADQENPMPPPPPSANVFRVDDNEPVDEQGHDGALNHNGESNREEYYQNLEAENQGRGICQEGFLNDEDEGGYVS